MTNSRYDSIIAAKESLIREADVLAGVDDFRGGHQRAQDLLRQWKAAGHAGPSNDELWRRFKAAQDTFYSRMRASRTSTTERRHPRDGFGSQSLSPLSPGRRDRLEDRAANLERILIDMHGQIGEIQAAISAAEMGMRVGGSRPSQWRWLERKHAVLNQKWLKATELQMALEEVRRELSSH